MSTSPTGATPGSRNPAAPIDVTAAAARAILARAERDGQPGAALRVRIQAGGCSGVSYKMDWEAGGPAEGDFVAERDGAVVVVDPRSIVFLKSSTLDYESGLMHQRFVWRNPNAKSSCGCGESFSV